MGVLLCCFKPSLWCGVSVDGNACRSVWITMKSGADIYGPLRLNLNDFGDPLTFHLQLRFSTCPTL